MKKFIKRNGLLVLALLMSTVSFAQEPGDFGDPTDPNPTDAPIGDYIWVVAVIGIAYVFYKLQKNRKFA